MNKRLLFAGERDILLSESYTDGIVIDDPTSLDDYLLTNDLTGNLVIKKGDNNDKILITLNNTEMNLFRNLILNNQNITGINSLVSTTLTGTIQTPTQPNITSLGTLTSLNSSGNITTDDRITINNMTEGVFSRIIPSGSVFYIQSGSENSVGSSADIFFGNISQSTTTSDRKIIFKADGKVGIGLNNPSTELEVLGTIKSTDLTGTLNTSSQPNITSLGPLTGLTLTGDLTMNSNDINLVGDITCQTLTSNTTTPNLSEFKSTQYVNLNLETSTTTQEKVIQFITGGNTNWRIGMDNTPSGNSTDFSIKQLDNINSEFIIDTSGNVGINQVSPNYKLDVSGDINNSGDYRISGTSVLNNNTLGSSIINSSLTSVGTLTSLTTSGNITSLDRFTINNTTESIYSRLIPSTSKLFFQVGTENTTGSSADLFIGNVLQSETTSSRKFMIKSDGKVGIQKNNPTTELDVNGTITGTTISTNTINSTSDLTINTGTGLHTTFTDSGKNLQVQGNITCDAIQGTSGSGNNFLSNDLDMLNNDINNINILNSTTINGTINTPNQPNITSLGTLTSLNTSGDINLNNNDILNINTITGHSTNNRITLDDTYTYTTGYLGIGQDTPLYPLHIEQSGDITIYNKSTDNNSIITLESNSTGTGSGTGRESRILFRENNTNLAILGYDPDNNNFKINTGSSATLSDNDLVLTSTGNVGIGLGNPTSKLQVSGTTTLNGNSNVIGTFDVNGTTTLDGTTINGTLDVIGDTTVSGDLYMDTGGVLYGDQFTDFKIQARGNNASESLILENYNGFNPTARIKVRESNDIIFSCFTGSTEIETMNMNTTDITSNLGIYPKNTTVSRKAQVIRFIANNTLEPVYFPVEEWSVGGITYTAGTGVFTFPSTEQGLYHVSWRLAYDTNGSGGRIAYINHRDSSNLLKKNSAYMTLTAQSGFPNSLCGSGLFNIGAGHTIRLLTQQNSGGTREINGTETTRAYIDIYKVGQYIP